MKNNFSHRMIILFGIFVITASGLHSQTMIDELRSIRALEAAGHDDLALVQYQTLLQKYPDNRLVFQYYTKLLIKKQKYQDALAVCQKAIHVKPVYERKVVRVLVLKRMGYPAKARAFSDSLFQIYGNDKGFIHSLASGYIGERLYDEAIDAYQKGAETIQEADAFAWNMASLYIMQQQFDKATIALLDYLESHPKQENVVQSQLNNMPQIKSVYQTVVTVLENRLKTDPQNQLLNTLLYQYYLKNEAFESAYKWLEAQKSQKLHGEWSPLYFSFGQITSAKEAYGIANQAFRAILSAENPYKEETVLHFLARNLSEQNKWQEAESTYQRLASRFPKSSHWPEYEFERCIVSKNLGLESDSIMIRLNRILAHPKTRPELKTAVEKQLIQYDMQQGAFGQADSLLSLQIKRQALTSPEWLSLWIQKARVAYLQGDLSSTKSQLDTLKSIEVVRLWSGHEAMNDGLELYWKTTSLLQKNQDQAKSIIHGEQLFFREQYPQSLVMLDSLIKFTDKSNLDAEAWFLKGQVLEKMGKFDLSLTAFDTVQIRHPKHRLAEQALEHTGLLLESLNKKKEAIERYEQLLESYPRSLKAESVRERLRKLEEP